MSQYPYDSFDPVFKSPFGAVKAGSDVRFSIALPEEALALGSTLLLYRADAPDDPQRYPLHIHHVRAGCNYFTCTVRLANEPCLYFYCFEVLADDGVHAIRRIDSHFGDFADGDLWQLTVYSATFETPRLPRRGIVYQIFPDRFCASGTPKEGVPTDRFLHERFEGLPVFRPNAQGEITNSDYFGGDLRGIMDQLDYIESLGVALIYLNPIFEAHSNHRYNVADYFKLDPLLGTNADFSALCEEAEKRGIGIILDGVFSHTGSDSVYFNQEGRYGFGGAYRDPGCRWRQWYKFESYPDKYHSWWGFKTLPEVDEENPDFLEFICGEHGVIRHWMSLGARGFRLDVVDELPDRMLDRLRQTVKTYSAKGILIGEVWEDASNKVAYSQRRRYLLGDQLDSVMNYPFMNAVLQYVRLGDCGALYHGVLGILENYPRPAQYLLFNSLSTHDTPRAITVLAGDHYTGGDREWQAAHHYLPPAQYERGRALLSIAYTLLYFLPGIPCLYYGDEAGLSGWRDPFNRTPYPWGQEDAALIETMRLLGRLYRQNSFLATAPFVPVISNQEIFIYVRPRGECCLTVAVNRGDSPQNISGILTPGRTHLITGDFREGVLMPRSAVVIVR